MRGTRSYQGDEAFFSEGSLWRGGRAHWRAPPRGRSGRARRRDRPPSRRGLDPRAVAMGCAASAQVRPGVSVNGDDAPSSPFRGASTSGRDHRGRHPADAAPETTVAYVAAHDDFTSPAKASAPWMAASDSPPVPMSPEPVTEGLFGGGRNKSPAASPPPAAPPPPASPPPEPPKKKLTAAQQMEHDRATLHAKLQEAETLMIKATEKSIAMATMEESMIRLQKAVTIERDGRRVAEVKAEEERRARERAEERIAREIEERHNMVKRVAAAQELAAAAEDRYRKARLGEKYVDVEGKKEDDRSEHEKILEADLAAARRELAELAAAHKEARVVADVEAKVAEDRPKIDEDLERVKTDRRVKEAVQMALAKHEREASKALMKASEDKVRALEVAGVQRRQAQETAERLHQDELRRAEERHARELEAVREEMRPTRWEFEKLQEERLEDQRKHAEDRRAALDEAAREYDAALEKLRFSHAYELTALRQAHEERLDVYRREQAKSETKLTMAVEHLTVDLREALRELEKERDARMEAEANSRRDLQLREEAELEFEELCAERAAALDLVSESQRARDTAERRTKETYLEIERARHAGDKRRWIHAEENPTGRPSTADREIAALPGALGLVFDDELVARVAETRAEVHDRTAPYRAAEMDLKRYRAEGGVDPEEIEAMSSEVYKRKTALRRASETFAEALAELRRVRATELDKVEDEQRALERAMAGYDDEAAPKPEPRRRRERVAAEAKAKAKREEEERATAAQARARAESAEPGSEPASASETETETETVEEEANKENARVGSDGKAKGKAKAVVENAEPSAAESARSRASFGKRAEEKYRSVATEDADEAPRREPRKEPRRAFAFTPLAL